MMKKVLSILITVALLLSSVPVVFAFDEEFVNENVIVNGDFEATNKISGTYAKVMDSCLDTASGWIPLSSDVSKISIGPEEGNEDNNVLILDSLTQNWHGVVQVLPINRKATGIYHIKFRAKNAGPGNRANVRCRISFVLNNNGTYTRDTNSAYRTVALGAEKESETTFKLTGNEWYEIEYEIDLMARSGSVYRDFGTDVAAIQIELYQDFDGKSNLTAAQQVGSDLTETVMYIDDVEVIMPQPLSIESIDLEDINNVNFDDVVIPISFNYDDGIYEDSLDNITILDNYGNTANYTTEIDGGTVNIKPEGLEPDTQYSVTIDNVVSSTPVFDPTKNSTVFNTEKRYVAMVRPQTFTFRTSAKTEIVEKDYDSSSKTATVTIKNNNKNSEESFLAVVFDEEYGKVNSKVYYCPVVLQNGQTQSVVFENAELKSNDYKVMLLDGFGGVLSEDMSGNSMVNIDFSSVSQTISVQGKVDSKYAGKRVTLEILLPDDDGNANDSSLIDTSVSGSSDKVFLAIENCTVQIDGSFFVDALNISKGGAYKVIAKTDGTVFASEEKFFSSKADNDIFLASVNSVSGSNKADELFEILEKENEEQKIRYDQKYYNMLDSDLKKLACMNLVDNLPFANIDAFIKAFNDETLKIAAMRSNSAETIFEVIKGNFDKADTQVLTKLLELDNFYKLSVYDDYNALSDEEKLDICKAYIENCEKYNANLRTPEEFADTFGIVIINRLIEDTILHKDISDIINNHEDILNGIDLKAYNELGIKQSDVNTDIKNNIKNTISEFTDYINNLIEDAEDDNLGGGGSSSGRGSSKTGSSKAYSADVPVQKPAIEVQKDVVFNDVAASHWAFDEINVLFQRGIISGKGNSTFEPDGLVTREEFVKMAVGACGLEVNEPSEAIFADVSPESWYAGYVATAYKNGIISGIGDGLFGTGMNISRQDMFVICASLIEGVSNFNGESIDKFADSSLVTDYARESINTLTKLGVINGDSNGCINPKAATTRAEAAKVIYDILKLLNKF